MKRASSVHNEPSGLVSLGLHSGFVQEFIHHRGGRIRRSSRSPLWKTRAIISKGCSLPAVPWQLAWL